MNCDIFSFNDLQDNLFNTFKYDEYRFNHFAKTFEKHLNIEVEPMEIYKKNFVTKNTNDNQITPNKI